jgi:hypothetical protein
MVLRYTCQECGLVVRVDGAQNHKACACVADFDVVDEDAEALPPDQPEGEP